MPDRSLAGSARVHRKADESDEGQVGAPMPGLIVSVSVAAGDSVAKGDRLFTIEAMKMESAVYATIDGTVTEVVVGGGTRVEAHDLVVVVEAAEA